MPTVFVEVSYLFVIFVVYFHPYPITYELSNFRMYLKSAGLHNLTNYSSSIQDFQKMKYPFRKKVKILQKCTK